jgi:hypothetical protein
VAISTAVQELENLFSWRYFYHFLLSDPS